MQKSISRSALVQMIVVELAERLKHDDEELETGSISALPTSKKAARPT